ncbi:MAG TPA: GNAT family N-acetyltransferase [Chloroflexota bacterium]|nr:GNAT family N-acetyltransferase [Chloroflexota bacterium]
MATQPAHSAGPEPSTGRPEGAVGGGAAGELDGVTLRPARAADSARCQEIALVAWERIHAERRHLLGETLYGHLTGDWRGAKAAAVARHLEQHPDWTLVACVTSMTRATTACLREAAHEPDAAQADSGEQVVGFVTFRLDREESVGTIGNNAVDPASQGRGIAGLLYRHVLERFRAEGMRVASVTTGLDDGHAPALAAYRKVGFSAEVPSVTLYQKL